MNNLERKLNNIKVKDLSEQESAQLWQAIWQNKGDRKSWSLVNLLLINKPMILALILMVVLGGSVATVEAADSSKPGDLLFPLDQAIERVQLSLTTESKKEELKVKIAGERVGELQKIIVEARAGKDNDDSSDRDEKIKLSLNLVADIRDQLATTQSTTTEANISKVLKLIENELSDFEGPIKWQTKFKGDGNVKFEIEAEEEDNGEIKLRFESKGFRFFNGQASTTATSTATSTPGFSNNEKIKVCHVASANNRHELKISKSALSTHLAHGDTIGDCPDDDDDDEDKGRGRGRDRDNATTSTSVPVSIDPIDLDNSLKIKIGGDDDDHDDDNNRGRGKDGNDD